jgi:GNAT superfamily N-acetyltransferase
VEAVKAMDSQLDRAPDLADDPGRVEVRAIRRTDAAALERFYSGLSAESRQTRFFSISSGLSHAASVSFCTTHHDHREGFVAVVDGHAGDQERIVGHLCLEPDGAAAAEVAIAVADEFQHQGIGRSLMAAGVAWARDEHIAALTATMLAGNAPIHRLLVGLGLPTRLSCVGAGLAEVTIELVAQSVAA